MTLFLSDTFTDVDGTLIDAHTPNVGSTWTALDDDMANANALTQTAKVLTNQAVSTSATSRSRGYRNPAVPDTAEYDVVATFIVGDATSFQSIWGLGARLSSTGTTTSGYDRYTAYYTGDSVSGSRKWWISMVVGGTWTGLASFAEDLAAGSYTMKFEVRNAAKKLYVDYGAGYVLRVTSTDNTITQAGRVGICLPRATSTNAIDTLTATTVAAAPSIRPRLGVVRSRAVSRAAVI